MQKNQKKGLQIFLGDLYGPDAGQSQGLIPSGWVAMTVLGRDR